MHLHCPSCGIQIQADDMNLGTGLAKCRSCHAVMNVADPVGENPPTALAALSTHLKVPEAAQPAACRTRDRVPQPKRVRVRDSGDALEISSRMQPSGGKGSPMIFFLFWGGDLFFRLLACVFCIGFLVLWFWHHIPLKQEDWPISIFVVVTIGMTYHLARTRLNRAVVRADSEWVRAWQGPLPWWHRRGLPRAEIQQLYCRVSPGPRIGFDVMALLRNNRRVHLLYVRFDHDLALFIEQTLEDYLGIADRPVDGELPR